MKYRCHCCRVIGEGMVCLNTMHFNFCANSKMLMYRRSQYLDSIDNMTLFILIENIMIDFIFHLWKPHKHSAALPKLPNFSRSGKWFPVFLPKLLRHSKVCKNPGPAKTHFVKLLGNW